MCGLSGFSGVNSESRSLLVYGLGVGIDSRGGHAAGYVSIPEYGGGQPRVATRIGKWEDSRLRFIAGAASSHTLLMHARYATCGSAKDQRNAHPFTIMRKGKPVLYGAHNGVLSDADDSAKEHGRKYTVDSREMFELLADGNIERIKQIHGYGVITWVEASRPNVVYLCKLTDSGDIEVADTKCGGLVWASTKRILTEACDLAVVKTGSTYTIDTGKVYQIEKGKIYYTDREDITLADRWGSLLDDDDFAEGYYDTLYRQSTKGQGKWWEAKTDIPTGLHEPVTDEELDWEMFTEKWRVD